MRRLLHGRQSELGIAWLGLATILAVTAWSVAVGDLGWALLGATVAAILAIPTLLARSPTVTTPWPVVVFAAIPFAVGTVAPTTPGVRLAGHVVLAAAAVAVVVQLDVFTGIRTNRGLAVALVVMSTVTVAGLWEVGKWLLDHAVGTDLVPSNDAVMWRLVSATGAGIVGGVVFDRYAAKLTADDVVPDGFGVEEADDQVETTGDAASAVFERVGLGDDRQRRLARSLQVVLVLIVGAGVAVGDLGVVVNGTIGIGATLVPGLLRRQYDVPADPGLTLWIATAVVVHSLGTLWFYQTIWGYHNVAHAISATLVAAVGYTALRALEEHTRAISFPPKYTFVVVVLFVFSAGVFWEIVEFTLDGISAVIGTDGLVLAQHGLTDTMSDLLANTVGAVVVAGAATIYRLRQ